MKSTFLTATAIAAAVLAACACASGLDMAAAQGFADPLDTPAVSSPLAPAMPVNGLAMAGTRVVAAGQRGHILYSDDRGGHWKQAGVPVSSDLAAITFAHREAGWAVGHDSVILHSADGGANWYWQYDGRKDPQGAGRPLLDVWFESERRGMAVGAFGLALCTDNGGIRWTHCEDQLDNPGNLHLNAIKSIGGAVYIVGEQGLLLRRASGEQRFAALPSPYKGSFFGVTGGNGVLLAYGLRGHAYTSTNEGHTWRAAATGVQTGLAAGGMLDDGALLLAGQAGQLLKSIDGGATFKPMAGAKPVPATALLPIGDNTVLVGGARGVHTLHAKN